MARIGSTASREELASDLNNAPMNLPDDKDSHAAIDRQLMRSIHSAICIYNGECQ